MDFDNSQILSDDRVPTKKKRKFNFDEFLLANRWSLSLALIGFILVGVGIYFLKNEGDTNSPKVEVLESATEGQGLNSEVVVEVSGAVEKAGVYTLKTGDRVEDALISAGGVSQNADRTWMEKFLNRASIVSDGQKIYIPYINEQSEDESASFLRGNQSTSDVQGSGVTNLININTASQSQLETLWGIGPVYAQNIIEQRPYSAVDELLSKGVIKSNVYERNKDKLTVY